MTGRSIIQSAMRQIGLLRAGRSASPSELAAGQEAFNSMLSSWNLGRLNVYLLRQDVYTLEPGKQSYTIGPGGDFDTKRPVRIEHANLWLPTSPTIRRKLEIWDPDQWSSITLQQIYTYPDGVYLDGGSPLSTLYFRPAPDSAYQFELYTWSVPDAIDDLDATIAAPDGYEEAMKYNLAVRLGPEFALPVRPEVMQMAINSKQVVQDFNAAQSVPRLKTDYGTAVGTHYNYMTGMVE